MSKDFADAITKMRLAGNIPSEDPEVVMAIVLSILYKNPADKLVNGEKDE